MESTPDPRALLAGVLPIRIVNEGEVLFREGEPGDSMVIVFAGMLRIEVGVRGGGSVEIGQAGPGQVVGEMTCLDPAPRSATVTAALDSTIITLDRGTLNSLRTSAPAVFTEVLKVVIAQVTHRVREADERVGDLAAGLGVPPPAAGSPSPGGPPPGPAQAPAGFSATEMALLDGALPRESFDDGGVVCREGAPGGSCFVLRSGAVEVRKGVDGGEIVLAVLAPGAIIGQMALVDERPRSATVRCRGPVDVLVLDRDLFDRMLSAQAPLALRLQEQIAISGIRQLRNADRWLSSLSGRRRTLPMAIVSPPRPPAPAASTAPASRSAPAARPAPTSGPSTTPKLPALLAEHPAPAPKTEAAPLRAAPPRVPGSPVAAPVGSEASEAQREAHLFMFMRTALNEWGMSTDDVDGVKAVEPHGHISKAELNARKGKWTD
ncbi:MAG: cyclic nucleotide-binding domain-containing protein [Deltaproteobacteria bacterium]|nr:cyclic nucleotide-binding domain-containing protein [Deltaproteobacteria bacterium]